MTQEIHQVLAEGIFERISYCKPSLLKEIQQVLKYPNIFKIGLYGTDGVGKTALVKELAQEVEKDGTFDVVVMAEVTTSPDVENIQGQIANALGLNFDEGRVEQLRQRIKKEKNILVILDDIWGKLDLAKVGIPFGDDHKGCKLLLTSENHNVLKRQMGTQKDFRLEILSDKDSWKLFKKIVGDDIKMNNIDQSIAQEVAKCCDGLPLFIVVVAKALRGKDASAWEDALYQLQRFDTQGLFKKSVCPLELSYHYLESEELKSLLLYIVLLGLDRIHSRELFSCYWGLYRDVQTLTEARNKYYKLINDLRASSMLLEGEIVYVRMHAVVRDMVKEISSKTHLNYEEHKFTQMEQWDIDQLKKCHYINLPSYNIDELPKKLECPELKLMSLRRNHGYLTIPDNFFSGMREVKVLNLHGIRFAPSPPPSLCLLTNLKSLNLYGCVLEDIAIVAELRRLEILTLERSEIQELPTEIGQLVYLRMLNLTNCYQLKTIPANLLSSLTRLEELYMGNCNIQWKVEGEKIQTNSASLGELRNLNQLTSLDLSIQDASVSPEDMYVYFSKLQRYNIFIGNTWEWSSLWSEDARENSRTLKLDLSLKTNISSNPSLKLLLATVEDLSLTELNFVIGVSYELKGEIFPQLRHLHIQNSTDTLHNLTLILSNLENMEDIRYSPLATHSFEKLQVIKVRSCHKLNKLLLYSLAKNLSKLQEMEVFECKVMEEIISEEKLEDEKEFPKIMLPKLHSLTLNKLPVLRSFYSPLTVDKHDPSIPVTLFNQKDGSENKGDALGEFASMNLEELIPGSGNKGDAPAVIVFMKLEELRLHHLPRLTSFCKASYNFNFPTLQKVRVTDCPNMKTFCHGVVITPSLSKVSYRKRRGKDFKEFWDGDLNTTLQRAAEET